MSRADWSKIAKDAFFWGQEPVGYIQALADWVECQAMIRVANGCDKTTLLSALKLDWYSPNEDVVLAPDIVAEDVFAELTQRGEDYTDRGYPFECIDNGRVLKFTSRDPWPYIFLLALSYTNPVTKSKGTFTAAYIFEALSWIGLRRFIGEPSAELADLGGCHHFGSPSLSNLPPLFHDRIDALATELREGSAYQPQKSGHKQKSGDGGLDVLLRRGFPDRRGAQFLYFGGCAAGHNWSTTKRYEVNPVNWLRKHFKTPFVGHHGMARCYFIPRHIGPDAWDDTATIAGTVIDRSRLSLLTCKSKSPHLGDARLWTERYCGVPF